LVVLRGAGIKLGGIAFDTMVADYLLEAGARNHSLDELALRYLDHSTLKIDTLIGRGTPYDRMDQVPLEQIASYAAEDADIPWRLDQELVALDIDLRTRMGSRQYFELQLHVPLLRPNIL
jgi:DNA polymerase-1